MTAVIATPAAKPRRPGREAKRRGPSPRTRPLELETTASRWQAALDAAGAALTAAGRVLPPREVARKRRSLAAEREQVADMLVHLARETGVRPAPWLSPIPVTAALLGLPATVRACLFDLEGVLTDSGRLHADAWGDVFDEFLLRLSERTGTHFIAFDRDHDYRDYIDGRPRLEGIHVFMASRGIRLPEGDPEDPALVDTAFGLAQRKYLVLARALRSQGVATLPGARRYLEAGGRAGLRRAVISSSARTARILDLANLTPLIDARIDADVIRSERLRSRPYPDMLLTACRRLGVEPEYAVSVTHSPAGVAAALAARMTAIAVAQGKDEGLFRELGAHQIVSRLDDLLDRRLR